MIQKRYSGALALSFMLLFAGQSLAEGEPEQIGTFDDWVAYSYAAADSKVCYVSSTPKATVPKNVKREAARWLKLLKG